MQPSDTANPLDSEGGVGGNQAKRADLAGMRLERMAIAQSWPLKLEDKERSLENVRAIQQDRKAGDRAHIAAARTLVMMTGQNLAAIDTALKSRAQEELANEIRSLKEWRDAVEGASNVPGD